MNYTVFDLRKTIKDMHEHYDPSCKDEITAYCDCGTKISQDMDECFGCGAKVIWKNSTLWRDTYGSPTMAIRRLRAVKPTDKAGKYLMKRAKEHGFRDGSEREEWEESLTVLGESKMIEIVNGCAKKTSGRGLIKYAINAARKAAEHTPAEVESRYDTL